MVTYVICDSCAIDRKTFCDSCWTLSEISDGGQIESSV